MSVSSRKEIRASAIAATRQNEAQIGSLVNDLINLTLAEINEPGWATKGYSHLWSWLRQKTTFATVASQEDYVLAREVDKIGLVRQTTSPTKLTQLTDQNFYKLVPNPTLTGNPTFYRMWANEGVAVRLAAADTIDVVSSSTGDAGSSELSVTVSGYVGGIWTTETYQLNGTTTVSGSNTFQAREVYISKQKDTTGTITVTENSGGTTLLTLGAKERSPKFKVLSLYPIPSSAITMYLEYYRRIPQLENDSDVPILDDKFHYVVRMGTIAKIYQYLGQKEDYAFAQQAYRDAVKAMVDADMTNTDLIEKPERREYNPPQIRLHRSDDAIA